MRKGKQFLGIMAAAAVLSLGAVPVAAEQTVTDMPQMTIVTDKEEYSAGDNIKETIRMENTTGKDIENITVEGNIPEGYTIDGAASGDTTWKMTIERLEAGKTIEKNAPEFVEADPEQQEPEKEPGQTFQADLTTEKETFTYSFTTEEQMTDKNLFFDLGLGTTVYLDQVRIEEDSLIQNGDFAQNNADHWETNLH